MSSFQNESDIDYETRAKMQEEEMKTLIEPKQDDMVSTRPPKHHGHHKKNFKKHKKNKNQIVEHEVFDDEQVESKN
jgi:hypothetical protein